jgi:hypothetical protein
MRMALTAGWTVVFLAACDAVGEFRLEPRDRETGTPITQCRGALMIESDTSPSFRLAFEPSGANSPQLRSEGLLDIGQRLLLRCDGYQDTTLQLPRQHPFDFGVVLLRKGR